MSPRDGALVAVGAVASAAIAFMIYRRTQVQKRVSVQATRYKPVEEMSPGMVYSEATLQSAVASKLDDVRMRLRAHAWTAAGVLARIRARVPAAVLEETHAHELARRATGMRARPHMRAALRAPL